MAEEYMYTPEEQKKINDAVEESAESWIRQKTVETTEKGFRQDVVDRIIKEENVPIDKTLFNNLVKERFEGKSSDTIEKHENVVALDEMLRNNAAE